MEDKAMKIITGLLAIVAGAIVFNTATAVPRYSASVPQVGSHSSDLQDNQIGGLVPPSETIFSNKGRIHVTQGGDDIVKKSGDAIGVVRPSGESHWFGEGNNEGVPKRANQNSNEVGNDPALRRPRIQSEAAQLQNTRNVSMTKQSDVALGKTWVQETKETGEVCITYIEPIEGGVILKKQERSWNLKNVWIPKSQKFLMKHLQRQ